MARPMGVMMSGSAANRERLSRSSCTLGTSIGAAGEREANASSMPSETNVPSFRNMGGRMGRRFANVQFQEPWEVDRAAFKHCDKTALRGGTARAASRRAARSGAQPSSARVGSDSGRPLCAGGVVAARPLPPIHAANQESGGLTRGSPHGYERRNHRPTMKHLSTHFVAAIAFTILAPSRAENWPGFRGPTGQGHSKEKGLPIHWSAESNVLWKTAIPGDGWSSPIVWENRVFVSTATESGTKCRVLCLDE